MKTETPARPAGFVKRLLAIDCGSTTTKAVLIERRADGCRLVGCGEAPTTVEKPAADVMLGVRNAIVELQDSTGLRILKNNHEDIIRSAVQGEGIDAFLATSSAGGGLQILVAGVVKAMSAESAQRAALGAGAIVVETLAIDDGRPAWELIERIRTLRPDMILLSGGVEGGAVAPVLEMADLLAAARPQPRLEAQRQVPLLYAGNTAAVDGVRERLSPYVAFEVTENLRPQMERENLTPARSGLQRLFLDHVMRQAPGYPALAACADAPVLPTPAAVGELLESFASRRKSNLLAIDIGGATTDVFSVVDGVYRKTVAANLGMSYSIGNVAAEAGYDRILRLLPMPLDETVVRDALANKMLRPTSIPETPGDLALEQAVAREAIRLAFEQHRALASGLKGVRRERSIGDLLVQVKSNESAIDPRRLGLIIGSGGVLSHAPSRVQAALLLIDAVQPEFVTGLAVDSVFMMPHLGVLSRLDPEAAIEVFERDCLVPLGTCIAPVGNGVAGHDHLIIEWQSPGEDKKSVRYIYGTISVISLKAGQDAEMSLKPSGRLDVGAGPGRSSRVRVSGGVIGVIVDLRGRPLNFPADPMECRTAWASWNAVFDGISAVAEHAEPRTQSEEEQIRLEKPDPVESPPQMALGAYVPGLAVTPRARIVKLRKLPVSGTVKVETGQNVTGDDVIAVADLPGAPILVPLAGQLGCMPSEAAECLCRKPGDAVRAGEKLAETPGIFGFFTSTATSPVDGVLESVSPLTGQAIIRATPVPVELASHLNGIVESIQPGSGAAIACSATFVQGIFGVGGEARGRLMIADANVLLPEMNGNVVLTGSSIDLTLLEQAAAIGLAGLIAGSIHAMDLEKWLSMPVGRMLSGCAAAPLTLILTEGFGRLRMSDSVFRVLTARSGSIASIDGTTQIRAGAIRPEIVISWGNVTGETSDPYPLCGLRVGGNVRLIREPRFGVSGRVTALPRVPAVLATGSRVRVAEVYLPASGETILVPRANLEIIES